MLYTSTATVQLTALHYLKLHCLLTFYMKSRRSIDCGFVWNVSFDFCLFKIDEQKYFDDIVQATFLAKWSMQVYRCKKKYFLPIKSFDNWLFSAPRTMT